jgi:hypothetical protein
LFGLNSIPAQSNPKSFLTQPISVNACNQAFL